MLFFFKKKPVEIIAYIRKEHTLFAEVTPIVPAKKMFPAWWKNVPSSGFDWNSFSPRSTVKNCPGIVHSLTTGFMLPCWSDLAIEWNKDYYRYKFGDLMSNMSEHHNDQAPGFYLNHWITKIESPWILDSPVPMLYTFPIYSYEKPVPFISPYGINRTIGGKAATNIFVFLEKTENLNQYMFKVNDPLMHIIPLTEKSTKIKIEIVTDHEWGKIKSFTAGQNAFTSRGLKNQHWVN